MSNLPKETIDKIKNDAHKYLDALGRNLINRSEQVDLYNAYIAGVTEWAGKAQGLVEALEAIVAWEGPTLINWPIIERARAALGWKTRLNDYESGATEYAIKLHQAEQEIKYLRGDIEVRDYDIKEYNKEIKELKQWKKEATELLQPILDYGQSKESGILVGGHITKIVLERCKQYQAARALLEKFISRHEGGLLPDRFLYNEIKTFLDGK